MAIMFSAVLTKNVGTCRDITRVNSSVYKETKSPGTWNYIQTRSQIIAEKLDFLNLYCQFSNVSNTKDRVCPHLQVAKRELKIRGTTEYFWRTSRCLEMCWNTFLGVWQIFSIEYKTKEKTEN